MDAQQFLAEFGHIANAPGGVDQLRKLILRYAISGRLVENNENEDLEDYFQAIQEDMATEAISRNIKVRSYSGQHSFAFPLSIPKSWKLLTLSEFALINMGQSPKSESVSEISKTGLPFFQGKSEFGSLHPTPRKWCSEPKKIAVANDILLSVRAPVGPTNLAVENTCIGRGLTGITALGGTNYKYLLYVFRALEEIISAQGVGTTFIAISLKDVQAIPIPVPPLEEQSRIVAKVDELMTLCDQLEAQQQKRRTLQNHLRQATLQAVAASQSPHELQDSWQRLQANFGQLFSAPGDVADVRQMAMELAVRGLLTEQKDTDESANHILLRCAEEYKDLVRNGEIKRRKPLPEIDASQAPFDLPKGWVWARFPELGIFGRGKSKHRPRNDPKLFTPGIYPLVQTGEVARAGNLINEYHSKYSEVGLAQSKLWPEGTLCITIAANIADSAILGFEACFPDSVVGFIPAKELRDKVEYFLLFMKTAREQLLAFAPSTAQKNINLQILESVLIPVPPKEEIARILSRMGQINALCDTMLSARSKSLSIGKLLAEASVSALTGIAIEQEEEPMKAPQTELVAPVRLGTPPDAKAQAPLATILARHNGEMSAKDLWQRFGGEIDAFYAQLKAEVAHGWLLEPAPAEVREKAES